MRVPIAGRMSIAGASRSALSSPWALYDCCLWRSPMVETPDPPATGRPVTGASGVGSNLDQARADRQGRTTGRSPAVPLERALAGSRAGIKPPRVNPSGDHRPRHRRNGVPSPTQLWAWFVIIGHLAGTNHPRPLASCPTRSRLTYVRRVRSPPIKAAHHLQHGRLDESALTAARLDELAVASQNSPGLQHELPYWPSHDCLGRCARVHDDQVRWCPDC